MGNRPFGTMKNVLIIAGVLVLSLGALVLWLSIEPPPDPPGQTTTGTALETDTQPPAETKARLRDSAGETAPEVAEATPSNAPKPDNDTEFRPITQIRSNAPQSATIAQPTEGLVPGSGGEAPQSPGSTSASPVKGYATAAPATEKAETRVPEPAPGKEPVSEGPPPGPVPDPQAMEPRGTGITQEPEPVRPMTTEQSQPASPQPAPTPAMARTPEKRRQSPRQRQRPPAPPGRYETITTATARTRPVDTGPIVDRIRRGTILNVTGSDGDWLVVYSKQRDITVYVRRDEAMLSGPKAASSTDVPESEWPRVEQAIRQAFVTNNVTGVQVTFIADTAYLKGTVKSERERDRAEIFARSVLEVKHVFNGIRVE